MNVTMTMFGMTTIWGCGVAETVDGVAGSA